MKKPITFYFKEGDRLCDEQTGDYKSPVIDGGENNISWHRLTLSFHVDPGAKIKVSFCAADNPHDISFENKDKNSFENPPDILLHGVRGRFFRFIIEFLGTGSAAVYSVAVSCPAETSLTYLPEVYRDNIFADRFLSIFLSLYDDMEEKIANSSALYDISSAPINFIRYMAEWIAFPDAELWQTDDLRKALSMAMKLYKIRGTLNGIKSILSLYTKSEIFFVETYHAAQYYNSENGFAFQRLYGEDNFTFWVLLYGNLTENEERTVYYLLEQNKPAHTTARLIPLKPCLISDVYTYLGINSVISEYGGASLNGECFLNYRAIE